MTEAEIAKLPECFREVIRLDRSRAADVVNFTEIAERRHQRRMCEIFLLDRLFPSFGPGRPAAIHLS